MSIKNIIKVADYYTLKYNFDKMGQSSTKKIKKIDVSFQEKINNILSAYDLGDRIPEDGMWGDITQDALNKIQNKFKEKSQYGFYFEPFDSYESLNQLDKIIANSELNTLQEKEPESLTVFRKLLKLYDNFRSFGSLREPPKDKFKNVQTTDQVIEYCKGLVLYLENIKSVANYFTTNPELGTNAQNIINKSDFIINQTKERIKLLQEIRLSKVNPPDSAIVMNHITKLMDYINKNPIQAIMRQFTSVADVNMKQMNSKLSNQA